MSFKGKDKFSPLIPDHQTAKLLEHPHKGAVKEEVVQIFRIGSTK